MSSAPTPAFPGRIRPWPGTTRQRHRPLDTVTPVHAVISTPHPDGVFVILILDDAAMVAIHPPDHEGQALIDAPADVSAWAPDLILLALSEPASGVDAPPSTPGANISLVDAAAFQMGQLLTLDAESASRCSAVVCAPTNARVEVFDAPDMVALIASGLVLQLLSGVAASATRDVDQELAQLLASLPASEQPTSDPEDGPAGSNDAPDAEWPSAV